jgi:hypothetical protein
MSKVAILMGLCARVRRGARRRQARRDFMDLFRGCATGPMDSIAMVED